MTDPATRPATYADLEALPPHLTGEIVFGALHTHPRPVRRHGGAARVLGAVSLGAYQLGIGGPGGWIFVDEPELHLGPHVLVPDISGWKRERMTEPADQAAFAIAPNWICEVLSPSTEKRDKGEKLGIYATYGVGHLWYIDPRSRTHEAFERQDRDGLLKHTYAEHEDVCAPPFLELTFPLKQLWPFPQPTDPTT